MKIGVIADLHIDRGNKYSPEDFEYCLIKTAQNKDIELLLIAGDISNNYQMTADYINKIKQLLNIPVLFIPGNHDFWTNDTDRSSLEILDFYLNMDECLIDRPYCINDEWAIVGNTAWYDYSYGDSKFSEERLAQRKYYGATWQDKEKIDWPLNDQSMSELALKQTEKDLAKVKDKKIILMTHIVTHSQFVVPTPHRIFDYFNAFIGTSKFNKLYNTYPIKYSINCRYLDQIFDTRSFTEDLVLAATVHYDDSCAVVGSFHLAPISAGSTFIEYYNVFCIILTPYR